MSLTTRSSAARAESVPVSRPPSTPRPRLMPYVEIPVFRGGLASRASTPALRASSVASSGRGSLKRKGSEQAPEDAPLAKRVRKPRLPGPPITLAERAQSISTLASTPSRYIRRTPRNSVAPESQASFKVPKVPARVLRPLRRGSSPKADQPETVSAPPALQIASDDEVISTLQPGTPSPVEDEQPALDEEPEPQLPDDPLVDLDSPEPQVVEASDSAQPAGEGSTETGRRRSGRPRTLPRDAEGKAIKPGTTRKATVGGHLVTQVVQRHRGRPRRDGSDLVTVVQAGVESTVRSRELRSGSKKKARRKATPESESEWEEDESEDQPRGPTTRFRMPAAPVPVPPIAPDQVPQDVMSAYASHAALLQSHTEAGMPQLYAAFQTFWIPRRANFFVLMGGSGSGLPYAALTSQGGGPGSSTAVHLSNPSFFYWDPLPLVPGGIRCPAAGCSNILQQAGLVKQPRRVHVEGGPAAASSDSYSGFWIVAARYRCQRCGVRGAAPNAKVYSSYVAWDRRIVEGLPPLVRAEFPAVERKRSGRRVFFAAELALPPEHRMDPQFVSTVVPTEPQEPQPDPNAGAVPQPNGLEEPQLYNPNQPTAPATLAATHQPDHVVLPLPDRDSSPAPASAPTQPPAQASAPTQPPASGSQEAAELGEAAGQVFAEPLFGVGEPHAGESADAQMEAAVEAVDSLNARNEELGAAADDSLNVGGGVPESEAPPPSSAEGPPGQLQGLEVGSVAPAETPSTDVEVPASSSSGLPFGGLEIGADQVQPQPSIPHPEYPMLNLPLPARPSPSEISSSSTPPGPSTFAAPGPVPSSSTILHPYFAQFKAPTPQVTSPPQIMYFNPFTTPSASGSTTTPLISSWPTTSSSTQPGPSTTVSPYSILAGAVAPSPEANHMVAAQVPGAPIPVIGSFNAQSQVVVQVKKRRGPRKCSKCLQVGCKGANGVQYCPNPCIGCKQVDCKKPHTIRGNLCVEGNGLVETAEEERVPLEPTPSNSDSVDGNGDSGEVGQVDVHMQDAEGEPEHEPERGVL